MLAKKKVQTYKHMLRENSFSLVYISLFSILVLVPLLIGKPQYLVGIVVNTIFVYSTLKFGFKNTTPFLILPSCMTYLRGILFGNLTIFLVYLIPFIILSNGIYSLTVAKFKKNILGIALGSVFKAGLLYLVARILVNTISLPNIFLTTMGINQLITALLGGILGYSTYKRFKV